MSELIPLLLFINGFGALYLAQNPMNQINGREIDIRYRFSLNLFGSFLIILAIYLSFTLMWPK